MLGTLSAVPERTIRIFLDGEPEARDGVRDRGRYEGSVEIVVEVADVELAPTDKAEDFPYNDVSSLCWVDCRRGFGLPELDSHELGANACRNDSRCIVLHPEIVAKVYVKSPKSLYAWRMIPISRAPLLVVRYVARTMSLRPVSLPVSP